MIRYPRSKEMLSKVLLLISLYEKLRSEWSKNNWYKVDREKYINVFYRMYYILKEKKYDPIVYIGIQFERLIEKANTLGHPGNLVTPYATIYADRWILRGRKFNQSVTRNNNKTVMMLNNMKASIEDLIVARGNKETVKDLIHNIPSFKEDILDQYISIVGL